MTREESRPRVNSAGMIGPYGQRYSWVYWIAVAGAFVLLAFDTGGNRGPTGA